MVETRLSLEMCEVMKAHLKAKQIPYKALAEWLNLSEVSIKRLLNGHQAMNMDKAIQIAALIELSMSELMKQAEERLSAWPHYSDEQDAAFYAEPGLFSFLTALHNGLSIHQIREQHDLDRHSIYLYLRDLEKLGVLKITGDLRFKLRLPKHTAFRKDARFPNYYKKSMLTNLQQRVCSAAKGEQNSHLMMATVAMTPEEFRCYTQKQEALFLNAIRERPENDGQEEEKVTYSLVVMGAAGDYYEALADIQRKPVGEVSEPVVGEPGKTA
ncbi:helix-turn-helix domain-containing protein [Photobacterium sp. TY1-4]|uniref:helix-turn-helix domain-containing protein n=1 Tax=Photobacterium sp. TY1-4 TaxID=2899122 RepID=UPI0021BDF4D6|nr:helix-turn-helix transcriptional regulator [Photobacterium sp. TY1-4]UXI04006.1 helix-turn-helix transcriptional regulator [Photobacterium sp. TY1-4]